MVQQTLLEAHAGLGRFRGDAKLSTWIYRICVNVALGRLRARARKPPPVQAEATLEEAAVEATPETLLTKREDVARLYKILDALTPKKRVVLVLHEIQGLDIKQIAEIVGAPLVTVRTRLHYARQEFYRLIAEAKE